ncbi:hypothetical protein [Flavisphingomonas formosensis]|uniref:hypothetical protein n=1 Tax=Flavisphingomonas formosensis TaxID=861534 RepID=UPI0018DF915E|nr:hypothetical protein [Sphingomonas formosensis]
MANIPHSGPDINHISSHVTGFLTDPLTADPMLRVHHSFTACFVVAARAGEG